MLLVILLLMLFLGPIQVIWALISAFVSRKEVVRRHMRYYLIGVVAYFMLLFVLRDGSDLWDQGMMFGVHFFVDAFLLAGYHFWIVFGHLKVQTDFEIEMRMLAAED